MADTDPDETDLDEIDEISDTLADFEAHRPIPSTGCLKNTLLKIERREYIAALKRANGWPGEARHQLGVTRATFCRKMRRFGLRAADWRRQPPA